MYKTQNYYLYIFCLFFLTACSLELPTNKMLKECSQPISIQPSYPDPSNLAKLRFTLNGNSSDINYTVWKIVYNGTEVYKSGQFKANENPIFTFTFDGLYNISCTSTNNCGKSIDLTYSFNYTKKCLKPTDITATTNTSSPLIVDLSINGTITDIAKIEWIITDISSNSEVFRTEVTSSPFTAQSSMLISEGNYKVVANITNKCKETYELTSTYELKIPDIFKIEMVDIEGGTFQMGNNNGDIDEQPEHEITLSNFKISKFEVTQALWRAVMGTNPSYFPNCDECPVEQVSWNDTQIFIERFQKITGKSFRLPTEAEWEFVAKGGTKSQNFIYSGSNSLNDIAWNIDNAESKTHKVGLKTANELGIFDLTGNVFEWCQDWYDGLYYQNSPKSNPINSTTSPSKVLRGGSWSSTSKLSLVTNRTNIAPDKAFADVGFRLALD